MPHVADRSRDVDVLQGQNLLAEYRVHTFAYGLDFGHQFGNWGEIRAGAQLEQGRFRLKIGDPADPNLPQQSFASFDTRNYFVRFTYDRLDDINFPHRGQRATLQWSGVRNATGAEQTSDQVTLNYLGAHSFGGDTLAFSASAGMTLQSMLTDINLLFPLGGFLNLSGLRANSLTGPDFGIARVLYYRQIGRGGPGYLEVPPYLGLSLEAGDMGHKGGGARSSRAWRGARALSGMGPTP